MIYIAQPPVYNGCYFPFIFYCRMLNDGFIKKNIKSKIINVYEIETTKFVEEEDTLVLITGLFYLSKNMKLPNCKYIVVNSELGYVKQITQFSDKHNVIMVFDFMMYNLSNFKKMDMKNCYLVPPVYSKTLEFSPTPNVVKDIDVLFYGQLNSGRRHNIIQTLKNKKINVKHVVASHGKEFDDYLERSKIVLQIFPRENMNKYVDFYRISYLLSNKCFFIQEMVSPEEKDNYNKYKDYIIFSNYVDLANVCEKYLKLEQSERDAMTKRTYDWFSKEEDIGNYLTSEIISKVQN